MRSTESKGWTPCANILALAYPAFYNVDGGNGLNCNVESKYRKRMNDLGGKLNDQIKAAAKDAGVAYADPNDAFTAHRFCDTSNPWFISERPSLGKREVLHRSTRQTDTVQQELDEFGRWTQTFFHPTVEGQVAYFRVAEMLLSVVLSHRSQLERTGKERTEMSDLSEARRPSRKGETFFPAVCQIHL
jgi:hypothetical protein